MGKASIGLVSEEDPATAGEVSVDSVVASGSGASTVQLPSVLNPKSYDGARVLEASGRPMLVIGRSLSEVTKSTGTKSTGTGNKRWDNNRTGPRKFV